MVDANIVHSRIQRIRACIAKLKKITQTHTQSAFLRDSDAVDIAEHNLQTAIQCVLDIGNHLLADKKIGMPDDHKKVFVMLAAQNLLPAPLCDRLSRMAGLRNVLVHEYLDVNLEIVYQAMTQELADFEEFIKAVTKLI